MTRQPNFECPQYVRHCAGCHSVGLPCNKILCWFWWFFSSLYGRKKQRMASWDRSQSHWQETFLVTSFSPCWNRVINGSSFFFFSPLILLPSWTATLVSKALPWEGDSWSFQMSLKQDIKESLSCPFHSQCFLIRGFWCSFSSWKLLGQPGG